VIFPPADPGFVGWLKQYPQVTLRREPLPTAYGVNVKPQAILHLFDLGYDDVMWIDSDIILAADPLRSLAGIDDNTLVVTEEALYTPHADPDAMRARAWGFKIGRTVPFALNSGVVRATSAHRGLMERWRHLLESEQYRAAQRQDWRIRPLHMHSDQEVLTALLCSDEFAAVPLKILRRGKDIIQYFGPYGYTLAERFRHLAGCCPAFIHSQGPKPWLWTAYTKSMQSGSKDYLHKLYLELSPYTLAARRYRGNLREPASWMSPRSAAGLGLRALGFWYAPLVGLPLAALADLVRLSKPLLRARV
jgi:hypothetical protein